MDFRELILIVLIVAGGVAFVWNETGRNNALLSAAAITLGVFLVLGMVAVIIT
jgi:hypothetical protein